MKLQTKKSFSYKKLIIFLSITFVGLAIFLAITDHPPLAGLNIYSYLNSLNYTLENHTIQTDDGYLLGVQRIPCSRHSPPCDTTGRPPVFLMHGLTGSAMDWVHHYPNRTLALMLVEKGYDVWLGNNRGTGSSRKHVTLDPEKDNEFWNYSFHEIGKYDLPAIIDYILKTTGRKKVSYVGISQGFAEFLVMGSTRPEYNQKILVAAGLAPVTTFFNVTTPVVRVYRRFNSFIEWLYNSFSQPKVFDENWYFLRILRAILARNPFFRRHIGEYTMKYFMGASDVEEDALPLVFSNYPQAISLKQMSHFMQTANTGRFAPYDHENQKTNLRIYGETYPSLYDLTKVTAPLSLFYSKKDQFVNQDVLKDVMRQLPNLREKHLIKDDAFDHIDFMLHKNVDVLVYNGVIGVLDRAHKKLESVQKNTEKT